MKVTYNEMYKERKIRNHSEKWERNYQNCTQVIEIEYRIWSGFLYKQGGEYMEYMEMLVIWRGKACKV